MERFYELSSGVASFDDVDVKQWNLKMLRSNMALVGQEPVLFNVSIRDNIIYGAFDDKATNEDVEAAARMANIHDFIMTLPDKYDTIVGERGGQLSGGQKQRVAIGKLIV